MALIQIKQGRLAGDLKEGVYSFKGIPYAAPPTGTLRWQAPQGASPWLETRDARAFGNAAIQITATGLNLCATPNEDCLYLNVWTTTLNESSHHPVMVWIHPGGFLNGAGSMSLWSGQNIAKKDIVHITFNYRLGAFGFLQHPTAGGNFAVQDFVAALKWVAQNVSVFGGDSSNVTIYGQSAGAAAVRSLLQCPSADGLYHRAIIQSGGFEPYATVLGPSPQRLKEASMRMFEILGSDKLEELQKVSASEIRDASLRTSAVTPADSLYTPANLVWYPVADGVIVIDTLTSWARSVPVMLGCTEHEANFFYQPYRIYGSPNLVPQEVYTQHMLQNMSKLLFGKQAQNALAVIEALEISMHAKLCLLSTVAIWKEPLLATCKLFDAATVQVYPYIFSRVSPAAARSQLLSYHTSELIYIFGTLSEETPWEPYGQATPSNKSHSADDINFDGTDVNLYETMMQVWTTFARTGSPDGLPPPKRSVDNAKNTMLLEFGDSLGSRSLDAEVLVQVLAQLRRPS